MTKTCERLGMTRQNYYKHRKEREVRSFEDEIICKHVIDIRSDHPRMGVRKLLLLIKEDLAMHKLTIGRDRLFKVLRENGLLVEPYKAKFPKTTRYNENLPCFHNLIKDLEIVRPNQVWVSDITYIMTANGFCYLCLIMDLFSRKVVGFHVSESLAAAGCILALTAALKIAAIKGCIHHSDRGCQYASHEYVKVLRAFGLEMSMTEERHCYENAAAERLNGILKQEYYLGGCFRAKKQAIEAVDQAVCLYNTRRPHLALNYKTPEMAHRELKRVA